MSELIVKNANLKPAIEQMLRVADRAKGIMDQLHASTVTYRDAGGDDPAGHQFLNTFKPGSGNVINALNLYSNAVVETAGRLEALSKVLKRTEAEAREQAHQMHSGPRTKR